MGINKQIFSKQLGINIANLLVEHSTKKDDIKHISLLLGDLSETDRNFLIKMLEQWVTYLKVKS